MTTIYDNNSKSIKIEDLPKKYQIEVNKKILGMNAGIDGKKGPNYDANIQELIDKYYKKSQQEKKENRSKNATNLGTIPLKDIDSKIILKCASRLKEEFNKKDNKKDEKQKELEELKKEVENLKKKDKKARMKAENLNLKTYGKKEKNGQPIADEEIRQQFNKAFDEWLEINKEYQNKSKEYENKKQQQEQKQEKTKDTKNKEHNKFAVQKDVAKKQNDVKNLKQFITEQFKAAEQDVNKKFERHHSSPLIRPCKVPLANSFFDEKTAKSIDNEQARISQDNIKQQYYENQKANSRSI